MSSTYSINKVCHIENQGFSYLGPPDLIDDVEGHNIFLVEKSSSFDQCVSHREPFHYEMCTSFLVIQPANNHVQ
jgi:hypothetical protein